MNATRAQKRARSRIANASKATRARWAKKGARTRTRNLLQDCRKQLSFTGVPALPAPQSYGSYYGMVGENPSWSMHRSRMTGQFIPRGGKYIRAIEHNPAKRMDHYAYPVSLFNKSDEELRFIIKDANEAMRAMPDGENAGYYADEVNYAADEIARRRRTGRNLGSNPFGKKRKRKLSGAELRQYFADLAQRSHVETPESERKAWNLALLEKLRRQNPEGEEYMQTESNPELLVVESNPGKRRKGRKARKSKGRRKGRGGPRRIKFRGRLLYPIQIMTRYGKAAMRKALKAKCRKSCKVGRGKVRRGRKGSTRRIGSRRAKQLTYRR